MNKKTKEMISYIIFGILTTIVSWCSYTLFINTIRLNIFWSNIFSWILAISFAFVTNKLWVFDSKSWTPKIVFKEAVSFLLSRGITGIIEIVFVPLLEKTGYDTLFFNIISRIDINIKILFTNGIYSKITISIIIVILNYFFSKLIVFKYKKTG